MAGTVKLFILANYLFLVSSAAELVLNTTYQQSDDGNVTLPTNYEYYTSGGIKWGLDINSAKFYLNAKEIFIYGGSFHYFRTHRTYWRSRLRAMRAAGLNAVATYIPWNLHEPRSGVFDWGKGGNEMSDFVNLEEFINLAKAEDLFVIIRTGPYICAEIDFGGFPSWLLREDSIDVRTSNSTYMKYVRRYFGQLLPMLAAHQFQNGGPIIMFQVENEYSLSRKHDLPYMKELAEIMWSEGIKEPLVTADNPAQGTWGTLPDMFLMTAIFGDEPKRRLDILNKLQPNRPRLAIEFWGGWFDNWGQKHSNKTAQQYRTAYEAVLSYPSSINVYLFVGGTNFGFLNGAGSKKNEDEQSDYYPVVSSYDYLSPISEAGDYTERYYATKELLAKYNPIKTKLPTAPIPSEKVYYNAIKVEKQINLNDLLQTMASFTSTNPISMEKLPINEKSGQSYGYIVYRKTNLNLPAHSVLEFEGRVCDTFMVLVNGVLVSPWVQTVKDLTNGATSYAKNPNVTLTTIALKGATVDIVVENWGRVSGGTYKQFKGIWQGGVKLNKVYLQDWTIYPLEFKKSWVNSFSNWSTFNATNIGPVLYKATLHINGAPKDTFAYMELWGRGIVIVNGFVLGRYAQMGPVQTLYLPAPFLTTGSNNIYIFEHLKPHKEVIFSKTHVYKNI